MKHFFRIVTLVVIISGIAFVYPKTTMAEGNPVGYDKVCLKPEKIIEQKGSKTVRKRKLTGTGLPIGKTIYIVNITQSKAGQIITTGDQAADTELAPFGAKYVAGVMQYVSGQAKMNSIDGNVEVIVNAVPAYEPARHTPAQYFAVFPREPQPTGDPTQAAGTVGGLQQGPLGMDQLFSPGSTKDCASIQWDPEGRVFDANTLEPMENISVTILDSAKKTLNVAGVRNPDITDVLGNYTFYVEEGDYYLSAKLPNTYTMVTDVSQIHQNYTKVYSDIYKTDEKIVERIDTPEEEQQGYPNVEHRDIALISTSAKTNRPLSILAHTEIAADDGEVYSGQTTHPLTKIFIKQGGVQIAEGTADKNGAYSFPVAASLINPQTPIDISYEKVDLTQLPLALQNSWLQKLIGVVFAQQENTVTIRTQPILQNVDGYAYNQNGGIIPFATVNLRLKNNDAVAVQVKADEAGHFSVVKGAAPSLPYYFEFIDPTSKELIKKETSEFSVNNNVVGKFKQNVKPQQREIPDQTQPQTTDSTKTEMSPMVIASIVFILILGAVTVVMVATKKKVGTPMQ